MRMIISLLSVCLAAWSVQAAGRVPQAPRPPQAPPVAAEPAPQPSPLTQEEQWRRDGWFKNERGEWCRWITPGAAGRAAAGVGLSASRLAPIFYTAPAARSGSGC
jgi:hypothetical protein